MLAEKLSGAVGNGTLPTYIEDVFSTYLYTGNGGTQTITNGIDLSTKGGMVWTKNRTTTSSPQNNNRLYDTNRGMATTAYALVSNTTAAEQGLGVFSSINTDGFTLGGGNPSASNVNTEPYTSWTFRKQPKFFDVVTYTGNGATQNIAHSLGSVPGCVIVKNLNTAQNWQVYHQSVGNTQALQLNGTAAASAANSIFWNNTTPTSTQFTVGTANSSVGDPYIAYLFAHNAGGFGLNGTDNVISCGSMTLDGSGNATANLGYEPQFVIYKMTSAADDWRTFDTMRGLTASNGANTNPYAVLKPNTSDAEGNFTGQWQITSTGLQLTQPGNAGQTYIYIAIRRGPMKVPTDATKVFKAILNTGTSANATLSNIGFAPDLDITGSRDGFTFASACVRDKLRGSSQRLNTGATSSESSQTDAILSFNNTTISLGPDASSQQNNYNSQTYVNWIYQRAPSFFDEVCYTGTGVGTSQTHNLGKIPELKIIKSRSGAVDWVVGGSIISGVGGRADSLILDSSAAISSNSTYWDSADTSTTFSVRAGNGMSDGSGSTYVAYLFATCPGVSKVGSYTGNGSTQAIACGFAGGARFVMIKRTDSTGDWYVWDTARGIVSGTDPHLSLNTTAAEVTSDDTIDPDSSGFIVNQLSATNVNVSSATYIYLAIA